MVLGRVFGGSTAFAIGSCKRGAVVTSEELLARSCVSSVDFGTLADTTAVGGARGAPRPILLSAGRDADAEVAGCDCDIRVTAGGGAIRSSIEGFLVVKHTAVDHTLKDVDESPLAAA